MQYLIKKQEPLQKLKQLDEVSMNEHLKMK